MHTTLYKKKYSAYIKKIVYYSIKGVVNLPSIKCNLSTLMGTKRLKITDMHEKTGMARDTISSLYNEKAKGITFDVLTKLCTALDCQPGDLLEYKKDIASVDPAVPPVPTLSDDGDFEVDFENSKLLEINSEKY